MTFANWRNSTVLSPIQLLECRQLAKVQWTFPKAEKSYFCTLKYIQSTSKYFEVFQSILKYIKVRSMMFPPWLSPISLSIKCGLKNFLSATLMSVSYDIPIPITLTWALTYILYWYCLVTTDKVHLTFANWRKSTVISPIHPLTFAIGECPIGESLIGERPITQSIDERYLLYISVNMIFMINFVK
jgi:hypothetical protein